MYDRKTSDWRGLSPLARGTPILEFVIWTPMRFIPAGAGNSSSAFLCAVSKSVYPRWRGELSTIYPPLLNGTGLSPLARGTLPLVSCRPRKNRFIPAGAGNSQYHYIKECRIPVYPRWRGELGAVFTVHCANLGLSPLARGTHILIGIHELRPRFIPAGAGNSATRWQSSYPTTVYPRWRGELFFQLQHCCCIDGLSPLARGTLNQVVVLSAAGRFIPAGAGNSRARGDSGRACTVYPRWRGELRARITFANKVSGLSPLARGTQNRYLPGCY